MLRESRTTTRTFDLIGCVYYVMFYLLKGYNVGKCIILCYIRLVVCAAIRYRSQLIGRCHAVSNLTAIVRSRKILWPTIPTVRSLCTAPLHQFPIIRHHSKRPSQKTAS